MPDIVIVERLQAIANHISVINRRMVFIKNPSAFKSKEGQIIFDSILIRLQALGENIKKIEAIHPGFMDHKLAVDVDQIIRFRDIISHHYDKLDSEIIFDTITIKIPELKLAVQKQLKNLQPPNKKLEKLIKKATKNKRGIKR